MSSAPIRPKSMKRWERAPERIPAFIENWGRGPFYAVGLVLAAVAGALTYRSPWNAPLLVLAVAYWGLGL